MDFSFQKHGMLEQEIIYQMCRWNVEYSPCGGHVKNFIRLQRMHVSTYDKLAALYDY